MSMDLALINSSRHGPGAGLGHSVVAMRPLFFWLGSCHQLFLVVNGFAITELLKTRTASLVTAPLQRPDILSPSAWDV